MARPKRIGALVPSTNQVVEPDFNMMAPKGVTVHAERMWLVGSRRPRFAHWHPDRAGSAPPSGALSSG